MSARTTDECEEEFFKQIKTKAQAVFPDGSDYYYRLSRELATNGRSAYDALVRDAKSPPGAEILELVFGIVGRLDEEGWPTAAALADRAGVKKAIIAGVEAYGAVADAVRKRNAAVEKRLATSTSLETENKALKFAVDDLKAKLANADGDRNMALGDLKTTKLKLSTLESRFAELTAGREKAAKEHADAIDALSARAKKAVEEVAKTKAECEAAAKSTKNEMVTELGAAKKNFAAAKAKLEAESAAASEARDKMAARNAELTKELQASASRTKTVEAELAAATKERTALADRLRTSELRVVASDAELAKLRETSGKIAAVSGELEKVKGLLAEQKALADEAERTRVADRKNAEVQLAEEKAKTQKFEKLLVEQKTLTEKAERTCAADVERITKLSDESKKFLAEAQQAKTDAKAQIEIMQRQLERCKLDSEKCGRDAREGALSAKSEIDNLKKELEAARAELAKPVSPLPPASSETVSTLKDEIEQKDKTLSTVTRALLEVVAAGFYMLSLEDKSNVGLKKQAGAIDDILRAIKKKFGKERRLRPDRATFVDFSDMLWTDPEIKEHVNYQVVPRGRIVGPWMLIDDCYENLAKFVNDEKKAKFTPTPSEPTARIRRLTYLGFRSWPDLGEFTIKPREISNVTEQMNDCDVGSKNSDAPPPPMLVSAQQSSLSPPPMSPPSLSSDTDNKQKRRTSVGRSPLPPPMVMEERRQDQTPTSMPSRSTTIPPSAASSGLTSDRGEKSKGDKETENKTTAAPARVWGLADYFIGR